MKITVQTNGGDFVYDSATGDNMLYAGLRAGLTLPYECATGTCGTCRARVVDGSVRMTWDKAPGAAKLRRDKGDVLLCQAQATSDCVARIPAVVTDHLVQYQVPAYFTGTIDKYEMLTHDVVHIEMSINNPMRFHAGQFVVVECTAVEGGRAYSMVTCAGETDRLVFVVKQKPTGDFSNWLFGGDRRGDSVRLFGPLGRATFHPDEAKNLLMIAGGSGIAGMMAIAQHAIDCRHLETHEGRIFFGVRTMRDIFYAAQLAGFVERADGRLKVTIALSDEAPATPAHPEHPAITLTGGFVHDVVAKSMAGNFENIAGYVAGPPQMVDAALRVLIMGGVPHTFIRYDKFA